MSENTKTSCGFACVVGLPNAGKSTLINHLVGEKVSIVSKKVNTTRTRVLGILSREQAQIILVDTPGIFDAQKTLERAMVGAAYEALEESDIVVHLVDASNKNPLAKNEALIKRLPENKTVILVLNKVDKVNKPELLALGASMNEAFDYAATFMISSLKGSGTEGLLDYLAGAMKEGPWLFEEDQYTDMPMRMMAAEITREKIFHQLHEELPYAAFVHTEHWEEFDNGSIKIHQLVYVQRDSQKAIVLGKGGSRIKKIGQDAREEMEELFGLRIHLKLLVKVQENWPENAENLRLMGLME